MRISFWSSIFMRFFFGKSLVLGSLSNAVLHGEDLGCVSASRKRGNCFGFRGQKWNRFEFPVRGARISKYFLALKLRIPISIFKLELQFRQFIIGNCVFLLPALNFEKWRFLTSNDHNNFDQICGWFLVWNCWKKKGLVFWWNKQLPLTSHS